MVKFGKPEATWKTREEENSSGRAWRRDGSGGRGIREEEKGQREKFHERATGWTGVHLGRKNRREIRDKETNIDNEKTSMAKKEAGKRSAEGGDEERSIIGIRIRIYRQRDMPREGYEDTPLRGRTSRYSTNSLAKSQ